MAIVYSLKVTQMDRVPEVAGQTDVVVRVHWAYTGTENDRSASFGGQTEVHYAAGDPFTAYENLTETQVANWVLAAWSEEEGDRYRAAIADQLAKQAGPLPWPAPNAIEPPEQQPA